MVGVSDLSRAVDKNRNLESMAKSSIFDKVTSGGSVYYVFYLLARIPRDVTKLSSTVIFCG